VADRDGLSITTLQGDMADLSELADASFHLIFHPVSNCFVPDVLPVWREAFRVLRSSGTLLAGFVNPVRYIFDPYLLREGVAQARYPLPYADVKDVSVEERSALYGADSPLEWSHTLSELIGGQMAAGFHLVDFYEDSDNDENDPTNRFFQPYLATRAMKL
jgi:SAM-dependent methyltransferase